MSLNKNYYPKHNLPYPKAIIIEIFIKILEKKHRFLILF